MTETTENSRSAGKRTAEHLPPAISRYVLHWGEMGQVWGVNRSVSQIHALLFISAAPMTAEDIADQLGFARSNVSTSLKELLGWRLVKRCPVPGDRRDHFEAEADMLVMVRRIARERKMRELDPAREILRDCIDEARRDKRVSKAARQRLDDMRDVVEAVDKTFDAVMGLPTPLFRKFIRLGGAITKLLSISRAKLVRNSG